MAVDQILDRRAAIFCHNFALPCLEQEGGTQRQDGICRSGQDAGGQTIQNFDHLDG